MKRLLSLLIAVVILVGLIGCGSGGTTSSNMPSTESTPTATLEPTPTPTPYIETNDPTDPHSSKYLGSYCSKDEIARTMGFTDSELKDLVTKYLKDKDYITDYGWNGSITEGDGYGNFILTYNAPYSSSKEDPYVSKLIVGYELLGGTGGKSNMIDIHKIYKGKYTSSENEQITDVKQVIKGRCDWGTSKIYR